MADTIADKIPLDLLERSLQLPSSARRRMAAILLESVEPEVDAKAMLTQRWKDYQSGNTKAIDIAEFRAKLQQRIEERRGK